MFSAFSVAKVSHLHLKPQWFLLTFKTGNEFVQLGQKYLRQTSPVTRFVWNARNLTPRCLRYLRLVMDVWRLHAYMHATLVVGRRKSCERVTHPRIMATTRCTATERMPHESCWVRHVSWPVSESPLALFSKNCLEFRQGNGRAQNFAWNHLTLNIVMSSLRSLFLLLEFFEFRNGPLKLSLKFSLLIDVIFI